MPGPQTMRLIDPDGITRDVPLDAAAGLLQDTRWRVPTEEDAAARLSEQAREESYGGVGGAITAGVAGALRGATVGLSDVAARALGGEDTALDLEGLREANPGVSGITEFGGALAPAILSGGATAPESAASIGARLAPAALAARAGGAVARVGEGALGRVGAAALGGAVEGGIYGAGQGLSEVALSQDPIDVEHVASALSSNALYGAGFGAGIGALGKAAELGLSKAKGAIDQALEKRAARTAAAASPAEAIESGNLEGVTSKALREAEAEEIAAIKKSRGPERQEFVDALRKAREEDLYEQPWNYSRLEGQKDRYVKGIGKEYVEADKKIRQLLKNEVGLADDPTRALDALQRQRQAIDKLYDAAIDEREAIWKAYQNAPQTIREEILSNITNGKLRTDPVPTEAWKAGVKGPFTEAGLETAVNQEIVRRYGEHALTGTITYPSHLTYTDALRRASFRNEKLQTMLAELARAPESDRLIKIQNALEVLGAPKQPSVGQAVLSAVAPFAGPVGAAAAAGTRVIGSFKKIAAAAGEKLGKAVSAFAGAAIPVTKYAVPLATKTLAAVRYGDDDKSKRAPAGGKTLPDLYEARATEVRNQVQVAPDGSYQMRPEARQKMAAKFDGIRPHAPLLADQLEEQGARRIEYLASIMPRLPDYAAMPGVVQPRISDMAMRSWARSAAALEDPHAVLERAAGGHVTLEDAAAIRKVYPELLSGFLSQVGSRDRKAPLPFKQRLALSILSGEPHDPALTPQVLSILQGSFTNDAGVPATQSPTAMPAFGSVKRSIPDPTPSQRRAQGEQA